MFHMSVSGASFGGAELWFSAHVRFPYIYRTMSHFLWHFFKRPTWGRDVQQLFLWFMLRREGIVRTVGGFCGALVESEGSDGCVLSWGIWWCAFWGFCGMGLLVCWMFWSVEMGSGEELLLFVCRGVSFVLWVALRLLFAVYQILNSGHGMCVIFHLEFMFDVVIAGFFCSVMRCCGLEFPVGLRCVAFLISGRQMVLVMLYNLSCDELWLCHCLLRSCWIQHLLFPDSWSEGLVDWLTWVIRPTTLIVYIAWRRWDIHVGLLHRVVWLIGMS